MAQTSIHICPVKGGSELHNERMKVLDYVKSDLSYLNQSWKSEDYPGIDNQLKRIKEDYKHAHGKKLHEKATPIREAVVVITERTSIDQLRSACERCREKFGIDAMQIHIHRDEGHTDEDDIWKTNQHAHIVFNWYNFITHTTCKLSRVDMVAMQTIFAECLQMERGVSSDVNHLNAIQQKNKAEAEKLHRIQEKINEANQELQTIQENVNTATQELHSIQEQICKTQDEMIRQEVYIESTAKRSMDTFDFITDLHIDSVMPTQFETRFRDIIANELKFEPPTDLFKRATRNNDLLHSSLQVTKALQRMVTRLKLISHAIPFFKKNQIAREAQLQARVALAEEKAANSSANAEKAVKQAENAKKHTEDAEARANAREKEAKETLQNLQARIDEAHKAGRNEAIVEWNKAYTENYKPTADERDRLKKQVEQLKKDLDQEIKDHTLQAVNTAKELQRQWGAKPFEEAGLEFTEFGSWQTAKKDLQKEEEQQRHTVSEGGGMKVH